MVGHEKASLLEAVKNSQTVLTAIGRRQKKIARKAVKQHALKVSVASPTSTAFAKAKVKLDNIVTIPGVPTSAVLPESKYCKFTITQTAGLGRVLRIQGTDKSSIDAAVKAISAPKWWAMLKLSTPYINEANWKSLVPRKFIYRLMSQQAMTEEEAGEAIFREFGFRTSWVQKQDSHMFVVVIPFPESVLKVIGQNKNGIGLTHLDIVKAAVTGKESPANTVTMSVVSPRSPRLAWKTDSESQDKKAKTLLAKELGGYSRSTSEVEKLAYGDNKHLHSANKGLGRQAWR
jgi:hypothetical protein